MRTERLTTNERAEREALPEIGRTRDEEVLRTLALRHLEHVRKFTFYASAYLLALVVLTPIWIVVEYISADGWPDRFSDQGNPGDWDPWILWVVLIGGFVVGVAALRTHFGRADTEADIEREVERSKANR